MYNFKRIAALGLAFTMVFGSTVTAFADDNDVTASQDAQTTISGTGTEDYVNKNVMKVTLPTADRMNEVFDYRLDPQGLIAKAKTYGATAVTGTATGIVFLNTASGKSVISNTSDPLTIINKSSIPVDLAVEVNLVAADSGLALTTVSPTSDFTGDGAGKAIYLGIKGTNDVERALSGNAIKPDTTLLSGESQYTSSWDSSTSKYTWAPIASPKWKEYSFTVTGAINTAVANSTWATIADNGTVTTKNPPTITFKYKLTAVKDALPLTLKWTTDSSKNDILQIGKAGAATGTGGFVAADYGKIYINGREITASDAVLTETGYITVALEKIYPGYKTTPSWANAVAKDKTEVKGYIKSVKTTATDKPTFYGEF
jgi:hypothetical protein